MNSELYDKTFNVPNEILDKIKKEIIKHPDSNGIKRAKFILKNKKLSYSTLKRLKNFFDTFNSNTVDKTQYELAGGNFMRYFVNHMLNTNRDAIKKSKRNREEMHIDLNLGINAQKSPNLNENNGDSITEKNKKNAIAIIVNNDNKFLLLKRSDDINQWMPSKWAFVGGEINDNESPENACKREIKEETGLNINNLKEKFIIRNQDSTHYIYICKYNGELTNIILNDEHVSYGWYDVAEIDYLDIVPNLKEFLNLAFLDY